MAASDKFYRDQKTLNIVFAASSVVMLVATGWMFWVDYARPYKADQKQFRHVEEELAKRALIANAPDKSQRKAIVAAEQEVASARAVLAVVKEKVRTETHATFIDKVKIDDAYQNTKADLDSKISYYNSETEKPDGANSTVAKKLTEEIESLKTQLADRKAKQDELADKLLKAETDSRSVNVKGVDVTISQRDAEKAVSEAERKQKGQTELFDRFLKTAIAKDWGIGEYIRDLPILDGFAAPTRIVQTTHDDLPIDYGGFKYVTRYDRCTTCHQGMEKGSYTKDAITGLNTVTDEDEKKFEDAVVAMVNRKLAAKGQDPLDAKTIIVDQKLHHAREYARLKPEALKLNGSQVSSYAVHPRLDLFVDANSPHPAEKFGCTSCHAGQGTATTFNAAAHSPNTHDQLELWDKQHHFEEAHHWDFPMNPQRFSESGCVKCHYQPEGLIRDGNEQTAPKLWQGYSLVRELGCFGCHEISGFKGGRQVGPDMRLEGETPPEGLPAVERAKLAADTSNPAGTLRKVGPSLSRISEKTHEEWTKKWLKAPRDYRPETKMPHFYLQSTNTPEALKGTGQEKFPDAEIQAITHYLFRSSEQHLAEAMTLHTLKAKGNLTDDEKRQLASMQGKELYGALSAPASTLELPPVPTEAKVKADQQDNGRHLFAVRGCMACHQHEAMTKDGTPAEGGKALPSLEGESHYGPNLSKLAAKLGKAGDPASGRKWLVQWLLNPTVHSPRTLMPSVHLTTPEAVDVAAWLLNQPTNWKGLDVDAADLETLKGLARSYLKSMPVSYVEKALKDGFPEGNFKDQPEADEKYLEGPINEAKLKMFVGKKAINNLGCYACHSIPGFANAKPIGAALNDWGKKDPARIAFENGEQFVEHQFDIVNAREDEAEKGKPAKEWAASAASPKHPRGPYEAYFYDALKHHTKNRIGFLHLKLAEPRSYDYTRQKDWTDRTRMPQFKFARIKRLANEGDADFRARETKAEAEGREAVMTFILGLVAEPVPFKFVHTPTGDRHAEVRGRQVIEKFNCGSCHQIRPGVYDFKLTPDKIRDKDGKVPADSPSYRDAVLDTLKAAHEGFTGQETMDPKDRPYPDDNAWAGDPQKGEKLRARGLLAISKDGDGNDTTAMRLSQALSFKDKDGTARTLPANTDYPVFVDPQTIKTVAQPLGGQFALLLRQYLTKRDPKEYGDPSNIGRLDDTAGNGPVSYAAAPPSLQHEGERVQPTWLYQFLLNPQPIRKLTVLQMPKFSLSDDEAMALVNYFTAVSKVTNPAQGLTYPYTKVEQRDEAYLRAETRKYVQRLKDAKLFDARVAELKPLWEQTSRTEIAELKKRQQTAKDAKDAARADVLGKDIEKVEARIKDGKYDELRRQWEEREAYVGDAYRLIVYAGNQCLSCHQVGYQLPNEYRAPNLNNVAERLRPEWTEHWIAYPQRMMPYASLMQPLYKPSEATKHREAGIFLGGPDEQIKATRDVLMVWPLISELPIIKNRTLPTAAVSKAE